MKFIYIFIFFLNAQLVFASPDSWKIEWPKTDFSKNNIDYSEILSGGPPKDGIPAIDNPIFDKVKNIKNLSDNSPVISLTIGSDSRAYPVEILMFHEIVNDTVGGIPVIVTYCPLCNASIAYNRKVKGKILDFGTTGKLRYSDMVMYDRQTESWWQQFLGEGIVGEMTNISLTQIPVRIESFKLFKTRHPNGKVLIPNTKSTRHYGGNPYAGYDSSKKPFLYRGDYDGPGSPLSYVVMVGKDAWPLSLVRKNKIIKYKDIKITWTSGQASALDKAKINKGRDIGNVVVTKNGKVVNYSIPFAFAFKAFHKDGIIHDK
jgi:hypothetical protein